MSFKPYPKYKESGVEWLGRVPEHWEVRRLKYHLDRNDGGVWGDDPPGNEGTIVLRSTEQTVDGRWQIDEPAKRLLSPAEESAALLAEGDLLLTKSSGSSLHIGKTSLVNADVASMKCCYSNFMQRLRMKSTLSPKLAWYFLNNDIARKQFDLLSNSTTGLANLNGSIVGHVVLPSPPPEEQPYLTSFLDHETAKIDALIAEQQRLIELLQEKRQAVISHAVTKGLNPDAPMKDSGIEWLGEVPEHWSVVPFASATRFQEGPGIMAVDFREEGVPLLRLAGAQGRWASLNGCNYLDLNKVTKRWEHFRLREGDLLISGSASMGTVCEVGPETAGAIPYTGLIRLSCREDRIQRDFLRHAVVSSMFGTQLDRLRAGATIQHFGPTHLRVVRIALPPLKEQEALCRRLEAVLGTSDSLVSSAEAGISLLHERRSALISAAVTGQIDVRDFAPDGGSEAA